MRSGAFVLTRLGQPATLLANGAATKGFITQ